MQKFKVLREHHGDKPYQRGDLRIADATEVAHLVRAGVLEDPRLTAQSSKAAEDAAKAAADAKAAEDAAKASADAKAAEDAAKAAAEKPASGKSSK